MDGFARVREGAEVEARAPARFEVVGCEVVVAGGLVAVVEMRRGWGKGVLFGNSNIMFASLCSGSFELGDREGDVGVFGRGPVACEFGAGVFGRGLFGRHFFLFKTF